MIITAVFYCLHFKCCLNDFIFAKMRIIFGTLLLENKYHLAQQNDIVK